MNELKQRVLSDVKMFVLDMDGTFYLGDQLIEGSLEFIDKVKEKDGEHLTGDIELKNLTFQYPDGDTPVLKNHFIRQSLRKWEWIRKMLPFLQQETLPLSI